MIALERMHELRDKWRNWMDELGSLLIEWRWPPE